MTVYLVMEHAWRELWEPDVSFTLREDAEKY